MSIQIEKVSSTITREPFICSFGFKGGYATEVWQSVSEIESKSGQQGIGLCMQGILWSDSKIASKYSESAGNCVMYLMTEYALQLAKGKSFDTPFDLLDQLLPETYKYGKKLPVVKTYD